MSTIPLRAIHSMVVLMQIKELNFYKDSIIVQEVLNPMPNMRRRALPSKPQILPSVNRDIVISRLPPDSKRLTNR
jgi:hypothetical protein